jgi:alpha-amylase/alpha-mannosidase (GH57 family)
LPETAVDQETLQILAENGIRFTILAPWQADSETVLDTGTPYQVKLANQQSIAVFFYDQDLSTRISFDPAATVNADTFIQQFLIPKYQNHASETPELVLVASDGELYGHHQPFRDKFLSYLLGGALSQNPIETTYPALWLEKYPPKRFIQVRSNTSWSCHHGVTRWKGACGCTPHGEWKAPLRQALAQISELVDEQYLLGTSAYIQDPWELRHEYIHVVLGDMKPAELIRSKAAQKLDAEIIQSIDLLLQAQYERQRMFTSCGWFFDDFDRIEPRNNVSYTAQAVWLTYQATGADLSTKASALLRQVKSWRTGNRADAVFNHHLQRAQAKRSELH